MSFVVVCEYPNFQLAYPTNGFGYPKPIQEEKKHRLRAIVFNSKLNWRLAKLQLSK